MKFATQISPLLYLSLIIGHTWHPFKKGDCIQNSSKQFGDIDTEAAQMPK